MATVNSLVCWGGRLGKNVTLTIASPCVVTLTNHGLRDGTRLVFSTTGALPTGITAGTTYYAKSTAANTFNLYTDAALTSIVNTSGTQSGTHTVKSVLMAEYFAQYAGRWGDAGSERCYDGIGSWVAARSSATNRVTDEVLEIGQAYSDVNADAVSVNLACASIVIISAIDGVRTEAFHNGVISGGYEFVRIAGSGASGLYFPKAFVTVDGIQSSISGTTSVARCFDIYATAVTFKRCIAKGRFTYPSGESGFYVNSGAVMRIDMCLAVGCYYGLWAGNYLADHAVYSSTFSKNTYGVYPAVANYPTIFVNNISVGNITANWYTNPGNIVYASNNAIETGDVDYKTSGGTSVIVDETCFVDYANNDFRLASTATTLIDGGVHYSGFDGYDLAGHESPNYNNGGAEAVDIGCYEFDHGYGNHPASTTVTFYGAVAGSEIHVYDSEDNELVGTESCTANQSLTWGIPSNPNVKITIIKRGLRWMKFTYLSEEGPQTIPIFPQPDLGYNNPA